MLSFVIKHKPNEKYDKQQTHAIKKLAARLYTRSFPDIKQ
jgi:hypothetical protein